MISALDGTQIDLIDISGGTYFPGAKSASDSAGSGPYFVEFARQARLRTQKPLMVTGGFKSLKQAAEAVSGGDADMVGLARALVLDPELPKAWLTGARADPIFPKFASPPEGGITAWYTMRITQLANDGESSNALDLEGAVKAYGDRDLDRLPTWRSRLGLLLVGPI